MVAPVKNQNLRAAGDLAGQANGKAIGVGGGQGELPVRQAEAFLQFLPDHNRVFAGQHEGDAPADLLLDGGNRGGGRVPGHGAGIAEAEIGVAVAVHVHEVCALGIAHEGREGARPLDHPVHGHAAQQRFAGPFEQLLRLGMLVHKLLLLTFHERLELLAVNGFHAGGVSSR